MRGNRGVIGGGAGIDLRGQLAAQFQRRVARGLHERGDFLVVLRVHDDGDVVVVLGGAAEHGGAADVDVLDGVVERDVGLRDGGLERVKVHHHEVNRRDAVLLHSGLVLSVAADVEQAAVDLRVQRLHAAIEHLGEAGVLGNVLHHESGVAERFGRAAGGNEFHARSGERLGEGDEAGLVGNREERALNLSHKEAGKIPGATRRVNRAVARASIPLPTPSTAPACARCSPRSGRSHPPARLGSG